jgi:pimeloyl-ACP methyl ester carboxylesterase
MQKKGWFMCLVFGLTFLSAAAEAQIVPVDRVRYCRAPSWLPNCNGKTQDDYHWWERYNVAEEKQKRTYIARFSTPAAANVQHLVFIASGQRDPFGAGTLGLEGGNPASFLTGATANFVNNFSKGDATRNIQATANNLPARLLASGQLPPNVTYMAAAWDARYNWGFTPENKRDIVNAYYNWLKSKFSSQRLRTIYLVGHSRGGALVVELGKRFHQEFPQIPVIVHVLDGVANFGQAELGVNGRIDNPVTNDAAFFAERIDFTTHFPNLDNLRIYNQVSGARVLVEIVDAIETTRAFAQEGGNINAGWLRQDWSTLGHNQFITAIGATTNALNDFLNVHPGMVAARIRTLPPSPTCQATLVFSGGGYYNQVQFTGNAVSNSGALIGTWSWQMYNGNTGQLLGTASGQSTNWTFYKNDPTQSAYFYGRLTVTDGFGNSASTSCGIYL